MSSQPKLFLTCMSGPGNLDNAQEIVEPIHTHLDGIIWVLNDCPTDDPGARYLESVKGGGRIIHRSFVPRHAFMMNETLYTGLIQEGDYVLWIDALERAQPDFVSRIKSEIGPLMEESDVDVIYAWGKAYLFRYRETLEYRNSPHWTLIGHNGRAIEWSQIEPDEKKVRWNVRPIKRTDPYHYVGHYAKYWLHPAGSNSAALGLDHFPPGDRNQQFTEREARRLEFRRLMRERGYPMTLDGLKQMLTDPLDETVKDHLRNEKVLSDYFHYLHGRAAELVDSHDPRKALPIE